MSIKSILKMGDPRLFQVSEAVTDFSCPELKSLIQDLFETMEDAEGAALFLLAIAST